MQNKQIVTSEIYEIGKLIQNLYKITYFHDKRDLSTQEDIHCYIRLSICRSFNKLYCTSVYSLVQNVCHILKNIIILLEVRIMINCLKMYLVATTMLLFP